MTQIIYDEKGYIVLGGIELPGLPEMVQVDQYELHKKDEFHITLVGAKAQTNLPDSENGKDLIKEAVQKFASSNDLTHFELTNEFRLVTREERVTLVVMVKLDNIDRLYYFLNERFGINLPPQPTHITLYSLDPTVGISLNSIDELNSDTKVVEVPELVEALGL